MFTLMEQHWKHGCFCMYSKDLHDIFNVTIGANCYLLTYRLDWPFYGADSSFCIISLNTSSGLTQRMRLLVQTKYSARENFDLLENINKIGYWTNEHFFKVHCDMFIFVVSDALIQSGCLFLYIYYSYLFVATKARMVLELFLISSKKRGLLLF